MNSLLSSHLMDNLVSSPGKVSHCYIAFGDYKGVDYKGEQDTFVRQVYEIDNRTMDSGILRS